MLSLAPSVQRIRGLAQVSGQDRALWSGRSSSCGFHGAVGRLTRSVKGLEGVLCAVLVPSSTHARLTGSLTCSHDAMAVGLCSNCQHTNPLPVAYRHFENPRQVSVGWKAGFGVIWPSSRLGCSVFLLESSCTTSGQAANVQHQWSNAFLTPMPKFCQCYQPVAMIV